MKTLIIIPAYNEEANIERVVKHLTVAYPEYDYIIVNDGSRDATAQICEENGFRYLNLPINLGLSGAVQAGMKYAYLHGYDYALQFDGDGQHKPEYIADMLNAAEKNGYDIVVGSRFLNQKRQHSLRMAGNALISFLLWFTTGKTVKDTTSGMRLYNKKMIYKFATESNFGPEPDTLSYLLRCGATVGEVPVTMEGRMGGESYLTLSSSITYMARITFSILLIQWLRKKDEV